MFRKIMRQDNTTCEALAYMEEIKTPISGFNYCSKLDEKRCPDVIVLMTHVIHYNLLRLINMVFLDDQAI